MRYMVGIMHEWVLDPAAYDLARRRAALIDTFIAGLRSRRRARAVAATPADAS